MTKLALITALLCLTQLGKAIPLSPTIQEVTSRFSLWAQSQFHLYADSQDPSLVWYLPKTGGIKDVYKRPYFNIHSILSPSPWYFPGQELVWFQGVLDASGLPGSLAELRREAQANQFYLKRIQPTSADTYFLLSGMGNIQSLALDCSETVPVDNQHLPICKVFDQNGNRYAADFVAYFNSQNLSQDEVHFSALTGPGWQRELKALMSYPYASSQPGQNWNHFVSAYTLWNFDVALEISQLSYAPNWLAVLMEIQRQGPLTERHIRRQLNAMVTREQRGLSSHLNIQNIEDVPRPIPAAIINELFRELLNSGYLVSPWLLQLDVHHRQAQTKKSVSYQINYQNTHREVAARTLQFGSRSLSIQPITQLTIECLQGGWALPVTWANTPYCNETY